MVAIAHQLGELVQEQKQYQQELNAESKKPENQQNKAYIEKLEQAIERLQKTIHLLRNILFVSDH